MHVHHLPVRTTFRGTTDISVNFQQCIAPYDPTKKRPRGGDTPDASTTPPPAAASLGSNSPAPHDALFVSHFRGRKLLGRVVQITNVPQDVVVTEEENGAPRSKTEFEGVVLLVAAPSTSMDQQQQQHDRAVTVWDRFSSFTSWEHDREPTAQDTTMIRRWLDLSADLHRSA